MASRAKWFSVDTCEEHEEVDIENVDHDQPEGLPRPGVVEESNVTSDPGSLSNQWLLYDDQQLFDQTWPSYGEDDMDEESKATIERMLKEEQRYFKQKGPTKAKPKPQKAVNSIDVPDSAHIVKGLWTEEEIAGFHEGMELFGRQWSKIADHIGTRTALQVKNYARAYFKKLASKDDASLSCQNDVPKDASLKDPGATNRDVHAHLPKTFETGSPTCKSPKRSRGIELPRGRPRKNAQLYQANDVLRETSKGHCKSPQAKKRMKKDLHTSPKKVKKRKEDVPEEFTDNVNIIEEKSEGSQVVIEEGEKVHLQEASDSDEDIDVDVEVDSGEDDIVMTTVSMDMAEGSQCSVGCINKAQSCPVTQEDGTESEEVCSVKSENNLERERLAQINVGQEKTEGTLPPSIPVECTITMEGVVDTNAQESLSTQTDCHMNKASLEQPDQLMEQPDQATEQPDQAIEQPDQAIEQPDQAIEQPDQAIEQPDQAIEQPDQAIEQPDQVMEKPSSPSATGNCSDDSKHLKVQYDPSTDLRVSDVADQETNTPIAEMKFNMSDYDSTGTDDSGPDDGGERTANDWEVIPKATKEAILDRNIISEEEKVANPCYFKASGTSKTPQKYLLIRNKILDCWDKCKPAYLTKTAIRPSLRGCGDVNRIGAIHSALEHLGAINFGVENPFRLLISARHHTRNSRVHSSPHAVTLRPRPKRACNLAEAKADSSSTDESKPVVRVSDKPSRKRKIAYDPFKLIQCAEFSEDNTAPYHVVISSTALVVMDLHAHLSTTEIIGLLGGDYDETSGVLEISEAKPCRSLSTGMQCEMDPVSQTEASEAIMATGARVVGWYHSHPTFGPNPSVRDIETQADFQAWFGPHVPFVGVIVSPYLRGLQARRAQSVFNCLTIGQEHVQNSNTRQPYAFPISVKPGLTSSKDTLLQATRDLVTQYATYQHRTEMLTWKWPHNPDKLYMEKVLTSIKSHLISATQSYPENEQSHDWDTESHTEILAVIRSHITSAFTDKSSRQVTTSEAPSTDGCDQPESIKTLSEESALTGKSSHEAMTSKAPSTDRCDQPESSETLSEEFACEVAEDFGGIGQVT